jgi:hypothetical protein
MKSDEFRHPCDAACKRAIDDADSSILFAPFTLGVPVYDPTDLEYLLVKSGFYVCEGDVHRYKPLETLFHNSRPGVETHG